LPITLQFVSSVLVEAWLDATFNMLRQLKGGKSVGNLDGTELID
jgi:hypothetical protein